MEVLATNVRCHRDITGLRLPGLFSPLPVLSLYAETIVRDRDTGKLALFNKTSHLDIQLIKYLR